MGREREGGLNVNRILVVKDFNPAAPLPPSLPLPVVTTVLEERGDAAIYYRGPMVSWDLTVIHVIRVINRVDYAQCIACFGQ